VSRRAASLGSLALAAAIICGCGGTARLPVPDGAVVHLGDSDAAAVLEGGLVELLVAVHGQQDLRTITSGAGRAGVLSVRLLAYGGDTSEQYNSFVYGTAPAGATSVSLSWPADDVGGQVWGGAWLIALPEEDVTPDQLHWQFKAADGSVIASGDGVLTP
jgi:hypothetical protein